MSDAVGRCREGRGPGTEELLDKVMHDAGVLEPEEHYQARAHVPFGALRQRIREERNSVGHGLSETARGFAEHMALEVVHKEILGLPFEAYDLLKNVHQDWQRGQELRAAADLDAVDVAVVASLDFDPRFVADQVRNRPEVAGSQGGGARAAYQLRTWDAWMVPVLQRRADDGGLAAARALATGSVSTFLAEHADVVESLQRDVAFEKGFEHALFLRQQSEPAFAAHLVKLRERAEPPPAACGRL